MIDKILEFALRQRVFVLLGAVALLFVGTWSALRLPIDAVPDITNVQVQINTSVPSLAPEEIEKLVTYPIEVEMGGIEKLLEVRSISKFGLSQVTLIFQEGTDIYRARQLTGERLQAVLDELPPGVTPKLAPITTGLGEIYHYTVRYKEGFKAAPADPVDRLRELKLAQDYIVKPALRTVPGVTEVNTSGGYDKQIVIMPSPAKLTSVGLTVGKWPTSSRRTWPMPAAPWWRKAARPSPCVRLAASRRPKKSAICRSGSPVPARARCASRMWTMSASAPGFAPVRRHTMVPRPSSVPPSC